MGLKEIKQAGEMAARLTEAAQAMNSIANTYGPRYQELLTSIQATFGTGKTMANLTDAEVNAFFFGDLGDATAIANTQTILKGWETSINTQYSVVGNLPANDI